MIKISELSTDKSCDILCEITPFLSGIVADETLLDTLGKTISTKGKTKAAVMLEGMGKINSIVPILLKDHRADVFGVLAVLGETTVEAVAAQNILATVKQVRELAQDQELLDFLQSFAAQAETE
jgi:hypothetical protein